MMFAAVAMMIGLAAAPVKKVAAKPVAAAANAKGHYMVSLDRAQGKATFINLATLKEAPARTIRFWRLDVMSNDHMDGAVKYRQVWTEVKCAARTLQTLDGVEYGVNGDIVHSLSQPGKPNGIVPESWGESLYDAVCAPGALQKMDPKQALPDIATTISFFDDFYARHGKAGEAARDFADKGEADITAGRYESAIANFDQAVAAGTKDTAVFTSRAFAHFMTGDKLAAKADYDQALDIDPTLGTAYSGRADVQQYLGNYEAAVRDATRALELMPYARHVYAIRGDAYKGLEQWTLALADFDKALKLDPRSARAWSGRGSVNIALEHFELAISDIGHALTIEPDLSMPYVDRAYAYYKIGNINAAIADCDRAIALEPSNETAKLLREMAYEAKAAKAGRAPKTIG